MKIILKDNVKGKGKKGQMINVANGYANFLIKQNKALLANEENLAKLEAEKAAKEQAEIALLEEMKQVKQVVEKNPVVIKVKTSEDGRIFGSVSTKQICDVFYNENNIKLDKKKIKTNITINSLGVYKLDIELHKEVHATLKVHVKSL